MKLQARWLVGRTIAKCTRGSSGRMTVILDSARTLTFDASDATWDKSPEATGPLEEREWVREYRWRDNDLVTARVYCGETWTWTLSEPIGCVDIRDGFDSPHTAKCAAGEWLVAQGCEPIGALWRVAS